VVVAGGIVVTLLGVLYRQLWLHIFQPSPSILSILPVEDLGLLVIILMLMVVVVVQNTTSLLLSKIQEVHIVVE
jgi:ABC-type Mn2+/Zn2+ transport system permease subunit